MRVISISRLLLIHLLRLLAQILLALGLWHVLRNDGTGICLVMLLKCYARDRLALVHGMRRGVGVFGLLGRKIGQIYDSTVSA